MNRKQLFRKKTVQSVLDAITNETKSTEHRLDKHLSLKDLIAFGIAAIVGAGIFSTIGKASFDGGPGVIFLFLFTALACCFTAFAYAEFASMVPVSGSAYTYSYVAFGEIIAWIIGWALLMEYAVGNITVAISWSDYFTGLLESGGVHLPKWIQTDFVTAYKGHKTASLLLQNGTSFANLDSALQNAFLAWTTAPKIGSLHFIADVPALFIIVLITILVYRGVKESRNASNIMVIIKLSIVLLVIVVGVFYVDINNWQPFFPNQVTGVLKGVSAVFFAYIGFDAITTTAEECKNPQRDLPRSMFWTIVICTVLYIAIALVLTGMVPYYNLNVGDPLAFVFSELHLKWFSALIAVSAVVAMASVLLVFQMGQPRIWLSMSRDGLLPKKFSKIHPKFKTPSFATIVTGFVVAIPALFLNLTIVTDLCSIGTLFAFSVVCAGVLVLQNRTDIPRGKFKTPYINAKYIFPISLVLGLLFMLYFQSNLLKEFVLNIAEGKNPTEIVAHINQEQSSSIKAYLINNKFIKAGNENDDIQKILSNLQKNKKQYKKILEELPVPNHLKYTSGWQLFKYKIPMWLFIIGLLSIAIWTYRQNLSLLPLLGLVSCLYMMVSLSIWNWIYFSIWLLLGLIIYFGYSCKNSKLNSLKTK